MSPPEIFSQQRVTIVGVLNATPDSFSDGGRFVRGRAELALEAAVEAAESLVAAGADLIDIGGESTRPGAEEVPEAVEIARTAPVVAEIAKRCAVPISIDTRKAGVAEAALEQGATWVNDVSGFAFDPRLAEVTARFDAGAIVGHLRGTPDTMQERVAFDDVVAEVTRELRQRIDRVVAAGVSAKRVVADPGIGFGKTLDHNLALLANVGGVRAQLGCPVLVGPSRKSFLGTLTGDPVEARDGATHAACAIALFEGADGVRVHDVDGCRRAAQVALALRNARRAQT